MDIVKLVFCIIIGIILTFCIFAGIFFYVDERQEEKRKAYLNNCADKVIRKCLADIDAGLSTDEIRKRISKLEHPGVTAEDYNRLCDLACSCLIDIIKVKEGD